MSDSVAQLIYTACVLELLRKRFAAKLIVLISLAFLVPVITSLITITATSRDSLEWFHAQIASQEPVPPEERTPERLKKILERYEEGRTATLIVTLIVVSFVLAGVVLLISLLMLKRAMRTLKTLSSAMEHIGRGEFSVHLDVESPDEFGQLAKTFALMTKQLTETTVSRDFYNRMIEFMPAALLATDHLGRVNTWNRQAELLTGRSRKDTLQQPLDNVEPAIAMLARDILQMSTDGAHRNREVTLFTHDGSTRTVLINADTLKASDGFGIMASFVDISHQKELERHLIIAKERAEEGSRLRSEFLANMSHEIRTPLNGILGLAQVLAEEETDAEKKQHLETIDRCGRDLLHLINEILELSKLESGRMNVHADLVSPRESVKTAVATIFSLCAKKDLTLHVDVHPDTPQTVYTDARKLSQILLNLLGNAAKFTERGEISLSVAPYSGKRAGDLMFTVRDSGPGIEPERAAYIFESFVQGGSYLSHPIEGTGLGLAIARKLTELLGGEMWLESTPGKGSAFSFTIDANRPEAT